MTTPPRKFRSARDNESTVSKSRKLVGSSKHKTCGLIQQAAPIMSFDFCPPDKLLMALWVTSSSERPNPSKCLTISLRVRGRSSSAAAAAIRSSRAVASLSIPSWRSFAIDSKVFLSYVFEQQRQQQQAQKH
eukprot:TRINITY_DN3314_c2_g1_i2.p1 TRINITY_DN3314_c2_g1~~TRINITY_DN3314_c2_g1_i2.p1  ORF type:complete len:132 (+),score=15.44 TRINITY_DN3314_c2_g1_i2:229-624(+)